MSCLPVTLDQLIRFCPRVCAITSKSKIITAYFGTLVLARLIISLASSFSRLPTAIDLYSFPVDAFNLCVIVVSLRFMSIPNTVGVVFGTWLRSL